MAHIGKVNGGLQTDVTMYGVDCIETNLTMKLHHPERGTRLWGLNTVQDADEVQSLQSRFPSYTHYAKHRIDLCRKHPQCSMLFFLVAPLGNRHCNIIAASNVFENGGFQGGAGAEKLDYF